MDTFNPLSIDPTPAASIAERAIDLVYALGFTDDNPLLAVKAQMINEAIQHAVNADRQNRNPR